MYWDSSSIIPLKRKSQHLRRDIFGGFSSLWSFFSHTNTPLCCVTWAFCQKCHQWSVADTLTSSLIRHLRICPRSAMLSVWRNSMLLGVRIFVYFLYICFMDQEGPKAMLFFDQISENLYFFYLYIGWDLKGPVHQDQPCCPCRGCGGTTAVFSCRDYRE